MRRAIPNANRKPPAISTETARVMTCRGASLMSSTNPLGSTTSGQISETTPGAARSSDCDPGRSISRPDCKQQEPGDGPEQQVRCPGRQHWTDQAAGAKRRKH